MNISSTEYLIHGLKDFGYSYVVSGLDVRRYDSAYMGFRDLGLKGALEQVQQDVYFVDTIAFDELFQIAKDRLKALWNSQIASSLLSNKFYKFDERRRFIKERRPEVKIRSTSEIYSLDLAQILSVEDFCDDEKLIIQEGIPGACNFRREGFIKDITTEDGFVSLRPSVCHFELRIAGKDEEKGQHFGLVYNCYLRGNSLRLIPNFSENNGHIRLQKAKAREIAARYGESEERYCFTARIGQVEGLLEEGAYIFFTSLNYLDEEEDREDHKSEADIRRDVELDYFFIEDILTKESTNQVLKQALALCGKTVSGNKDALIRRLADLLVELYRKNRARMDRLFSRPFLRVDSHWIGTKRPKEFEISLQVRSSSDEANQANPESQEKKSIEEKDLRSTLLALYILRHLRGERIAHSSHKNDSYTLKPLALALLNKDVSLQGGFINTI